MQLKLASVVIVMCLVGCGNTEQKDNVTIQDYFRGKLQVDQGDATVNNAKSTQDQAEVELLQLEKIYEETTKTTYLLFESLLANGKSRVKGSKRSNTIGSIVGAWDAVYQDDLRILARLEARLGGKYVDRTANLRIALELKNAQYHKMLLASREMDDILLLFKYDELKVK